MKKIILSIVFFLLLVPLANAQIVGISQPSISFQNQNIFNNNKPVWVINWVGTTTNNIQAHLSQQSLAGALPSGQTTTQSFTLGMTSGSQSVQYPVITGGFSPLLLISPSTCQASQNPANCDPTPQQYLFDVNLVNFGSQRDPSFLEVLGYSGCLATNLNNPQNCYINLGQYVDFGTTTAYNKINSDMTNAGCLPWTIYLTQHIYTNLATKPVVYTGTCAVMSQVYGIPALVGAGKTNFQTTWQIQADGQTPVSKTIGTADNIQSGTSTNFQLNGNNVAIVNWLGNLGSGQSIPDIGQVSALYTKSTNSWKIVDASVFSSNSVWVGDVFGNSLYNCIVNYEQNYNYYTASAGVSKQVCTSKITQDAYAASQGTTNANWVGANFGSSGEQGAVATIQLSGNSIIVPQFNLYVSADYITVIVQNGIPKIVQGSVSSPQFRSDGNGVVNAQIQNIGQGNGNFYAYITGCTGGFQPAQSFSTWGPATLVPNQIQSIQLNVNALNPNTAQKTFTGTCTLNLKETLTQTVDTATVGLSAVQPNSCVPNGFLVQANPDGSTSVFQCSGDGLSKVSIVNCTSSQNAVFNSANQTYVCQNICSAGQTLCPDNVCRASCSGPTVCTNGATNYPACTQCDTGYLYNSSTNSCQKNVGGSAGADYGTTVFIVGLIAFAGSIYYSRRKRMSVSYSTPKFKSPVSLETVASATEFAAASFTELGLGLAVGIIGLILVIAIFGVITATAVQTLFSPFAWGLSLLAVAAFIPTSKNMWTWAGLLTLVTVLIAVAGVASTVSFLNSIPLIGGILVGTIVAASLIPILIAAIGTFLVFVIQLNVLAFVYAEILKARF